MTNLCYWSHIQSSCTLTSLFAGAIIRPLVSLVPMESVFHALYNRYFNAQARFRPPFQEGLCGRFTGGKKKPGYEFERTNNNNKGKLTGTRIKPQILKGEEAFFFNAKSISRVFNVILQTKS